MIVCEKSVCKPAVIPQRFAAPVIDQFLYTARLVHDCQARGVIKFSGRIDVERMARAFRLTLDAEPVLGCRFIEHPWRPYWKRHENLDSIPIFSLVEPDDLDGELTEFMAEPMNHCADAQVRGRIFRSDQDTLCFKISHMVADAGGTMQYINLLAKTYHMLAADSKYYPTPNLHGNRGLGQVFSRVGLAQLMRACRHFSYPRSGWGFAKNATDFAGRAFSVRRIEPERFARIKSYGQQRGVTVSDVTLTAYYRALFQLIDPPMNVPLPLQMTVNLRRHMPSDYTGAICDLAAVFFPYISREPGINFDGTLAQIHRITEIAKANKPWLGQAFYLALASQSGFRLIQHLSEYMVKREIASGRLYPCYSNVGIIHKDWVDFGGVDVTDVFLFGPTRHQLACNLSVNTFLNTMVLTTSSLYTATDPHAAGRLLDLVLCELPD